MNAAEGDGRVEQVLKDLEEVDLLLQQSREFRLFLASPVISAAKKVKVFEDLLRERAAEETLSFVKLLTVKGREALLPEAIEQFKALHDERIGVADVHLTAAVQYTSEQERMLRAELEKFTGKKVRLHLALDPAIMGGLLIRIGDTVLDASIRHQLELLRSRFVAGGAVV